MESDQTEDLIKIILKGIVHECLSQGEQISESLAIFMLRVVTLDPKWRFSMKENITDDTIQAIIKVCSKRLLATYNPTTATIKMQVYFELNYRNREDFLKEHRYQLEMKLMPLLRTITTKLCTAPEHIENLYNQIIAFVILKTGMGNPHDPAAFDETKIAMEPLFSFSQMASFNMRSRREKKEYLAELCPIVAGIRLYNRYQGKGGVGIQNVSEILFEASPRFMARLEVELLKAEDLREKLHNVLKYHTIVNNETNHVSSTEEHSDAFSFLKSLLANTCQFEIFLNMLMIDADVLSIRSHNLEYLLKMRIDQLHSALTSTLIIPVHKVFPLYASVAEVWSAMQEEVVLLSSYSNIVRTLRRYAENARSLIDEDDLRSLINATEKLSIQNPVLSDVVTSAKEILKNYSDQESQASSNNTEDCESCKKLPENDNVNIQNLNIDKVDVACGTSDNYEPQQETEVVKQNVSGSVTIPSRDKDENSENRKQEDLGPSNNIIDISLAEEKNVNLILPESVKNFKEISLQYQAFCPWALVTGNGVLLPANRDFGIVMYNNSCYGFSSKKGGDMFLQKPQLYVEGVLDVARNLPELILLLHIYDYFHIPTWYASMRPKTVHPIFIANSSTQTVLHPIEKYIDVNYRWNQWELRRQALKFVDILTKQTHSTQTNLSHFRRENHSQVYPPKNNWAQTKRDGSTTMPRPGIPELLRKVRKTIL